MAAHRSLRRVIPPRESRRIEHKLLVTGILSAVVWKVRTRRRRTLPNHLGLLSQIVEWAHLCLLVKQRTISLKAHLCLLVKRRTISLKAHFVVNNPFVIFVAIQFRSETLPRRVTKACSNSPCKALALATCRVGNRFHFTGSSSDRAGTV